MIIEFIEGLKKSHAKIGREVTEIRLPPEMYARLELEIAEMAKYGTTEQAPTNEMRILGIKVSLAWNGWLSVGYGEG